MKQSVRRHLLYRKPQMSAFLCSALLLGTQSCSCDAPIGEAPDAPVVNAPQSPTRLNSQTLSGTKQSATEIRIDGKVAAELSDSSSWSASVGLEEGSNVISVTAADGNGAESSAVEVLIVADFTPPTAPVLDPEPPSATTDTVYVFTGKKESNSSIWMNGTQIVELDDREDWTYSVSLESGENTFRFTSQDLAGNESDAVEYNIVVSAFAFSVSTVPSIVGESPIEITGQRGAEVAVLLDGIEVLSASTIEGAWTIEVELDEGVNTLDLSGQLGNEEGPVTEVVVELDTTPPAVPTLDAIPTFTDSVLLYLSGTKEASSSILLDGSPILNVTADTAFTDIPINLVQGINTLEIRSADGIGNISEPITPAPTIVYNPDGVYLTVDTVPALVGDASLELTGERGPTVDVYVDDALVSEADGTSQTWAHTAALSEGSNTIAIEGRTGDLVSELEVEVSLDSTPPAAPVVNFSDAVSVSYLAVTGTKEANSAIVVMDADNAVISEAEQNASTSFTQNLSLEEGDNTFFFHARDELMRLSEATEVEIYYSDTPVIVSVDSPLAYAVVNSTVTVTGTAFHQDGVAEISVGVQDGTSVLATSSDDFATFTAELDLSDHSANGELVTIEIEAEDDGVGVRGVVATVDVFLVHSPIAISGGIDFSGQSAGPQVSIGPNGELISVFQDNSDGVDNKTFLAIGTGASLVTARDDMHTINDGSGFANGTSPTVATEADGRIHTLWADDGSAANALAGNPGLVYRSWNGTAFDDPVVLADGTDGAVSSPQIAVGSDGKVVSLWAQNSNIYLSVLDADVWGDPVMVNGGVSSTAAGNPRLAMDTTEAIGSTGTVHVVWQDFGNEDGDNEFDSDLYYRRYETNTDTLSDLVLLTHENNASYYNCDALLPALGLIPSDSSRTVYVAWLETGAIGNGPADCTDFDNLTQSVAMRSIDNAAFDPTFPLLGAVENVSDVEGHFWAVNVDLAADAMNNITVVWSDVNGNINQNGADSDIFLRRFAGDTFGDPISISDQSGNTVSVGSSSNPVVALDEHGNSHILWTEESNIAGSITVLGETDILYFAVPLP
jgi:hypothetical protein